MGKKITVDEKYKLEDDLKFYKTLAASLLEYFDVVQTEINNTKQNVKNAIAQHEEKKK